ncbi:Transcriptional regulatory protein tctD [Salinivirga cyanobacteriivorans]|uniref:Transcriptional regulatory protein tctD n=1 Tax=Salinivirga cyanobacteriivorans TaxID=1307839 RepID=A0A0S2HYE6_9BACT|nr:response regulator transcription factor [Salinivirga cyanobacteriivorans]ALO14994.1 Transcriptional regulatory protein tctD [Salinivirga cyanobacteriivorans]
MKSLLRILLVEDDHDLGNVLTQYLKMNKFDVELCRSGDEAMKRILSQSYALCILDVMLPGVDGFTLAEHIKNKQDTTPFLFLTARNMKTDVLKGLKMGADDYITKPFEPEELLLRIQNILKRAGNGAESVYRIGEFYFDYSRYRLRLGDQQRDLTAREADLLKLLIDNKNTVLKRSDILKTVWGEDDFFLGRSMDVFITRLRKYLAADNRIAIQSVRGVGIMLEVNE